jgi:ribonuclease P protein component
MQHFPKREHLCGKTDVTLLFDQSKRFTAFPLRIHYAQRAESAYSRLLISVPKKLFKHAVDRNLLKRRIREAYRLHKPTQSIDMGIVYMHTEIASFQQIEQAMLKAIEKINQHCQ